MQSEVFFPQGHVRTGAGRDAWISTSPRCTWVGWGEGSCDQAGRNIRDWVMAQLALYETEMVDMGQVFLPFATDTKGQTLYETQN